MKYSIPKCLIYKKYPPDACADYYLTWEGKTSRNLAWLWLQIDREAGHIPESLMSVPVMFQFPKFQPEFVEIHPDHDKCTSAVLHLSIVQLNLRSTSTTESISSFLSSSRGVASNLFCTCLLTFDLSLGINFEKLQSLLPSNYTGSDPFPFPKYGPFCTYVTYCSLTHA